MGKYILIGLTRRDLAEVESQEGTGQYGLLSYMMVRCTKDLRQANADGCDVSGSIRVMFIAIGGIG